MQWANIELLNTTSKLTGMLYRGREKETPASFVLSPDYFLQDLPIPYRFVLLALRLELFHERKSFCTQGL